MPEPPVAKRPAEPGSGARVPHARASREDVQDEIGERLAELRGLVLSEVDALEELVAQLPRRPPGDGFLPCPTKQPWCPTAGNSPLPPTAALIQADVPDAPDPARADDGRANAREEKAVEGSGLDVIYEFSTSAPPTKKDACTSWLSEVGTETLVEQRVPSKVSSQQLVVPDGYQSTRSNQTSGSNLEEKKETRKKRRGFGNASSVSSFNIAKRIALDPDVEGAGLMSATSAAILAGSQEMGVNFEAVFAGAIVTNAIFSGVEVQWQASHLGEDPPLAFLIVRHTYTMLFGVELCLRVMKMGCRKQFFTSEERAWAWLDVLVIVGGLVELATDIIWHVNADDGEKMSGSGTLRNVRLVRVVRITRAFRLQRIIRVISGLRTLVYSIAVTLKSLMWAMILLSIIMYVFSLAFTMEAIALLEDMIDHGGLQADVTVELDRAWGSLDRSMLTLFQSICGGVSWRDVVDPFRGSTVLPAYLFMIYMCFTYFAVLNVVTGIFCSSALETTQRNPDLVAKTLIDKRRQSTKMLRNLFGAIDDDDSGVITTDELDAISNNEMVLAYFQALDIDFRDAWTLFKLIDVEKTGAVKLDDFLTGCEQLRGGATNVHIAEIAHDVKKIGRTVKNLISRVDSVTASQKSAIKTNGNGAK